MNARSGAVLVLALLLAPMLLAAVGVLAPSARAAGIPAVTGSVAGPTLVSTGSVSYTHLRAHETTLHRV